MRTAPNTQRLPTFLPNCISDHCVFNPIHNPNYSPDHDCSHLLVRNAVGRKWAEMQWAEMQWAEMQWAEMQWAEMQWAEKGVIHGTSHSIQQYSCLEYLTISIYLFMHTSRIKYG